MTLQERFITVEKFERFVNLPENADRLFEFIGGEIIEVPSNPKSSKFATKLSTYMGMYLLDHDLGHLTGEAGGYIVGGERYAPDVAFISYEKQPELADTGYNPNPPDIAVEVVSSDTSAENARLTVKVTNYLAVGTIVWILRPNKPHIEVHRSGQEVTILREGHTLDGGDVLPGFKVKVADIFK